jgi:hypothetical protein
VRFTLLLDRHPEALGESVGAFLIALDDAPIFVGKSDWPPGFARLLRSGYRPPACIAPAADCCLSCSAGETHATKETSEITVAKRISMPSLLKWALDIALEALEAN